MTAPAPVSGQVRSADGTALVFDRSGEGPAVILVHGAFTDRTHPLVEDVAAHLAPWFTVFNFDRRGRGASGDTSPYAVEREIEDLSALIHAAGGTAMVFGGSSGAGLAARAASGLAAVTALALWEPPYHVDDSAPYVPDDFGAQLDRLVAAGRPGDAVARFMTEAAEVPADTVAAMRAEPSWRELEALAHTLGREAAVMGPGNALPASLLGGLAQPTLVLTGGASPAWMSRAGEAVAAAVPRAVHRVLAGQAHGVEAAPLASELLEFFTTVDARG